LVAFRVLQDAVQTAMDAGVIQASDAETCSDVLWAMMHGIVALAITMPMGDSECVQRLTDVARDMVFKAISQCLTSGPEKGMNAGLVTRRKVSSS